MLEREYYLIVELNMSYGDLETMPLEYIEWFYRKHYYETHKEKQQ